MSHGLIFDVVKNVFRILLYFMIQGVIMSYKHIIQQNDKTRKQDKNLEKSI